MDTIKELCGADAVLMESKDGIAVAAVLPNGLVDMSTKKYVDDSIFIRQLSVELTSAQLRQLHGKNIELIPAPDGGSYIAPLFISMHYKYGGLAFAVAGAGERIAVGIGDLTTSTSFVSQKEAGLFDAVEDQAVIFSGLVGKVFPTNDLDGQPVNIGSYTYATDGVGGDLSNGNGTLDVTVIYMIIQFSASVGEVG